MNKPKALLFDLGGVIIHLNMQKTYDALAHLGINETNKVALQDTFLDYEIGKISTGLFLQRIQAKANPGTSITMIQEAWNAMLLTIPEETYAILKELKKHFPLYLLSNTNELHIQAIFNEPKHNASVKRFEELFETCFYSHEIGLRKPNADCYQFVLARIGLEAEEIVFMEDTKINLEGAEKCGIPCIEMKEPINRDFIKQIQTMYPSCF